MWYRTRTHLIATRAHTHTQTEYAKYFEHKNPFKLTTSFFFSPGSHHCYRRHWRWRWRHCHRHRRRRAWNHERIFDSACIAIHGTRTSTVFKAIVIDTCVPDTSRRIFHLIASPQPSRLNDAVWVTIIKQASSSTSGYNCNWYCFCLSHRYLARSLARLVDIVHTLSVPINLGNLIWHAINTQNKLTGTNNNGENSFYQFLS